MTLSTQTAVVAGKQQQTSLKVPDVLSALTKNTLDLGNLEGSLRGLRGILTENGLTDLASKVPSTIVPHIRISGDSAFSVGGDRITRQSSPLFSGLVDYIGGKLNQKQLIEGVKAENYGISTLAHVLVRMDAIAVALDKLTESGNPIAATCTNFLKERRADVQNHIRTALSAIDKCPELAPVGDQIRAQLKAAVSKYALDYYEKGSVRKAEVTLTPEELLYGKQEPQTPNPTTVSKGVVDLKKIQMPKT